MPDANLEIVLAAKEAASAAFGSVNRMLADLQRNTLSFSNIARTAATAFGAYKIADFTKDATMAAARFETLGVVLERIGKNSAYTSTEIKEFEEGLRKTGIAGIEARTVLSQMIQSNLDLSKSSDLARVAQDAAVIANENSSETLQRMMHAIQGNSVEILRTIGLNVSFEDATKRAAAAVGKTTDELTEGEKVQARLNAVIAAGAQISGSYDAAMGTAGKQINSFKRYVQDFEIEFGKAFNPALTAIVAGATEAIKGLTEAVKDPKFQADMTKMANELGRSFVDGAKWLVENKEAVKGYFVGIAGGLNSIATAMGKLPPEAWGAILGYAVMGPAGAAIGAGGALGMRLTEPDRRNYGQVLEANITANEKKLKQYEEDNLDALMPKRDEHIQSLKNLILLEKDLLAVYQDQRKLVESPSAGQSPWSYYSSGRSANNGPVGPAPGPEPLSKEAQSVVKKFWEDYRKEVDGAYAFERQKLDDQLKDYQKHVTDKAALDRWYRSERRKIDVKEYAAGDISTEDFRSIGELMGGSENYDVEALRAKSYAANTEARAAYDVSREDQLKSVQAMDKALSEDNWFKTYIENTEEAARANEIFKSSMDVMSQSVADSMARMATGTGSFKTEFMSLVNSIMAGLMRISTQQSSELLFGYLMKGATSLAGAYLGGSTPTGMDTNTTFAGGTTMGEYMAMVKHAGGTVDGSGPWRSLPSWMFDSAPRLHQGLAADEYPAVLQRGERVIPRGGSAGSNITINVAAPTGRLERESLNHLQTALASSLARASQRNA